MSKTQVVPWDQFFAQQPAIPVSAVSTGSLGLPPIPSDGPSIAVHGDTEDLWHEVLEVTDWLALGILVFAGGMWMFGNRTTAMQRLIDMIIGYEIIRHGAKILRWLQHWG